jgi:hypothetical protein
MCIGHRKSPFILKEETAISIIHMVVLELRLGRGQDAPG